MRVSTAVLVRRLCDRCLSCAGFRAVCGSDSDGSHVQGWSDVHLSQFSCGVRSMGELSFRQSWREFPPTCRAFMMRAQDNYTLGREKLLSRLSPSAQCISFLNHISIGGMGVVFSLQHHPLHPPPCAHVHGHRWQAGSTFHASYLEVGA